MYGALGHLSVPQFINLIIANLVPRHIHGESFSWPTANNIIIRTCGKWKELRMIVTMYREVQNTRNQLHKDNVSHKKCNRSWKGNVRID